MSQSVEDTPMKLQNLYFTLSYNCLCSTDPNPKCVITPTLFLSAPWSVAKEQGWVWQACISYQNIWHTVLWGFCQVSRNIIPNSCSPHWSIAVLNCLWTALITCGGELSKMQLQGLTPVNETRKAKNKGEIVLARGTFSPLYKYWPLQQAQIKSTGSFYYRSACLKGLVCITQWVCYYLSFSNLKHNITYMRLKNNTILFESIYFIENWGKLSF